MGRKIGVVCLCLLASSLAALPSARADKKIVLVNAEPLFAAAAESALAPWPITIVLLRVETPIPESMPSARTIAHKVSQEAQSSAVVWLTGNKDGHALWVYDAGDDRVVVRELRVEQPLDEAGAASAALSLKSLLMHSHSVPAAARFGAVASEVPDERGAVASPMLLTATTSWALEALVGVQKGLAGNRFADPRFGLGVLHRRDAWEVGVRATLGPGHCIRAPELVGNYTSWELQVVMRYLYPLGEHYGLGLSLQQALQYSALEGRLLASGRNVDIYRLNPSIGAAVEFFREVGTLRIGAGITSTYMQRSQRYLVAGVSVLDLAEFNVLFGTSLTIKMP